MISKKNTTGIILAGGKSSRMGTDKGFLMLENKPFVKYCIDALTPLVSETIIVSDNNEYDIFKLKRIEDIIKNAGPLAGITSGIIASKTKYNLILSCDIPLINSEILQKLINNTDTVNDIIQIKSNGKNMPLIAIYKSRVVNIFNKHLKNNQYCLQTAIKSCKSKQIVLEKELEYYTTNVNTKTELKAVQHAYNH